MPSPPVTLTFDLLTLKVGVRVTCDVGYLCANLVFLGLSVLDLGPMYATDRQTDRQTSDAHHRLMPPPRERGIIIIPCGSFVYVSLHVLLLRFACFYSASVVWRRRAVPKVVV